ncbi:MAG: hypothetical protein U0326_25090 [Polyangiales bacterium]
MAQFAEELAAAHPGSPTSTSRGRVEGTAKGIEKGIAPLLSLISRKLGRPLSDADRRAVATHLTLVGPERLADAVLDLDSDALSAWLRDPGDLTRAPYRTTPSPRSAAISSSRTPASRSTAPAVCACVSLSDAPPRPHTHRRTEHRDRASSAVAHFEEHTPRRVLRVARQLLGREHRLEAAVVLRFAKASHSSRVRVAKTWTRAA